MIPRETLDVIAVACKVATKSYLHMLDREPAMENLIFAGHHRGYRTNINSWVFGQVKTLEYRLQLFYKKGWWDGTEYSLMNGIIDFPSKHLNKQEEEE
jgi:hypothetical protein|tara:strand:- start:7595 stop:7888 length:294 start_codon:yes stop_codon:yes gene_type:complete